jgi:hypothetical protein
MLLMTPKMDLPYMYFVGGYRYSIGSPDGLLLEQSCKNILSTTPFIPNYSSFDFFDPKFDQLSYSKICTKVVKFKSFLKNFC